MSKWVDVTSYSQNDTKKVPRTFKISFEQISICVTRHINAGPNDWMVICEPFYRLKKISEGTAEEAKELAIKLVASKLKKSLTMINNYQENI